MGAAKVASRTAQPGPPGHRSQTKVGGVRPFDRSVHGAGGARGKTDDDDRATAYHACMR